MGLGRAWVHDFEGKMKAASDAGFQGIEIFYEDLEYVAKSLPVADDQKGTPTPAQLLAAANKIKTVCDENNLHIIGLQPFLFYEGLKDRQQHDRLIEKLHVWFEIVDVLDTDIIQIPANFLPEDKITGDMDVIVADMVKVADLGASRSRPIRFAYENLCWSTFIDTWEAAWDVVQRVDRPNFGMCLDTFNIAGRIWADPASPTGMMDNAEAVLDDSLARLVKTVDVAKVFYIQVVDAERCVPPLDEKHPFHTAGQPSRMSWSRNARCFIYETDRNAYLPVERVARVIIEGLGYEGYVSMELFSRTLSDSACGVPESHARRGIQAWKLFKDALKLE
ncbi:3-dehydroshikimate dehydratase like protein [Zymoseptoria brevis]|uniref:3-dehydroshikimate dehydratase like protein n=1 Tax=Zymoseptoria brevis TaxID=1047168 RepID=A0A0F4G9V5_9PEZI|nr:3-dehydroshikimate dehydratase like protein [Zymoseptoria brevis]